MKIIDRIFERIRIKYKDGKGNYLMPEGRGIFILVDTENNRYIFNSEMLVGSTIDFAVSSKYIRPIDIDDWNYLPDEKKRQLFSIFSNICQINNIKIDVID